MQSEDMIAAEEFCTHHKIDISFIYTLKESGLVETIIVEEKIFMPVSQLPHLEKMVRLYFELGINLEGLETIMYLLKRMDAMQHQITELHNRLSIYENLESK